MPFEDIVRLWFVALYIFGLVIFVVTAVQFLSRKGEVEERIGPLPTPGAFVPLGIPLIILLLRFGELPAGSVWLQVFGLLLSLYYAVMLPWAILSMGRMYAPGSAVYEDHRLITDGPFRIVRHPIASAAIVLWLAAGLATFNWVLLVSWPILMFVALRSAIEPDEELLRLKFAEEYESYAERTSRVLPGVW